MSRETPEVPSPAVARSNAGVTHNAAASSTTGAASVVIGESTSTSDPVYFEYQVQRPARPTTDIMGLLGDLQSESEIGRAVVQYVVDSTGRVVSGTFRELASPDPRLTTAIRNVLPQMRFRPAELNGRKVSQIVQHVIPFGTHVR